MSVPLVTVWDPLVEHAFHELLVDALRIVPNAVAALLVLLVATEVGELLDGAVARAVGHTRAEALVADSPVGAALDGEAPIADALGTVVRYYVYLLALVTAASILGLPLLVDWTIGALRYAPALLGGVLLLVFGVVAVSRVTDRTSAASRALRGVLYVAVALVALDTMGADVGVLEALVVPLAGAAVLVVAVALGVGGGIALGLGGREYVAENLPDWVEGTSEGAGDASASAGENQDTGSADDISGADDDAGDAR
jgi:hypothetical protein